MTGGNDSKDYLQDGSYVLLVLPIRAHVLKKMKKIVHYQQQTCSPVKKKQQNNFVFQANSFAKDNLP